MKEGAAGLLASAAGAAAMFVGVLARVLDPKLKLGAPKGEEDDALGVPNTVEEPNEVLEDCPKTGFDGAEL